MNSCDDNKNSAEAHGQGDNHGIVDDNNADDIGDAEELVK